MVLRKKRPRRFLAGTFIVLGVLVMLFAPQSPGGWIGWILLGAGVVLEVIGIALERKA